jgi:hypothetical protein
LFQDERRTQALTAESMATFSDFFSVFGAGKEATASAPESCWSRDHHGMTPTTSQPTLTLFFQYGFVNYALELLVVKTFGDETWEKIK